jgi:preprotein translocase subunit SecD
MRNGLKVGLTIFFLLVTGYYLYPSIQNYFIKENMEEMSTQERAEYKRENFERIQNVEERSLKLGLDLLGGMHVTMEVQTGRLIQELATNTDSTFNSVLNAAQQRSASGGGSLIEAFVAEFEQRDPNARLSRYFRSNAENLTRRSTNEKVVEYLNKQADDATERAIDIIRDRVNRYGVTEPSIQRQGDRRIVVELPGVDDEERVRELLKNTARLEFRLTANSQKLKSSLQSIIQYYEGADSLNAPDTTAPADTSATPGQETDPLVSGTQQQQQQGGGGQQDTSFDVGEVLGQGGGGGGSEQQAGNPLLNAIQPLGRGSRFAAVAPQDTARANELLNRPEVKKMLPRGIELMYTSTPRPVRGGQELYYLLGIRENEEMSGEVITDARVAFTKMNQPKVTMSMNSTGARKWARLTGANVGNNVAIVMDGVVYSNATIQSRISGGNTEITGLQSRAEAQDIVTVLKSGAMPAPLEIVGERSVGPSLGQESIRAGLTSVLVGLVFVALFMMFYYRTGGAVADLALLLNLIFILGILAAFRATLTLPGIAGIVLTIGMAVDANVLIFDRIREEGNTGKTLKASVDGGYSKALSAIIDANITTFFVGAILYSFGVGPIQGFAVTLMAGILASLFSAIIITRIVFDYMIIDRKMRIGFG